ncbi:MAG: FHA domain-containing protein [Boseongicola sp.]|nr:FHA domain-containing protein [Boseongicola sp.]
MDEGSFDMDDDLDLDGPVASSVVSEVVASANAPESEDQQPEDDDFVRRQIAEMSGVSEAAPEVEPVSEADGYVNVAAAVSGRAGRSAGRVKTRLLGFQAQEDSQEDVFEAAKTAGETNKSEFPVGWIIVISGPGRGSCFTMFAGVSQIGRGEDQAVRLDFGDTSISRNNHAAVAYDDEQGKFFLGHGGKSNLVRLNGKPVLSTEELADGDMVRIGETTLKFVALCGEDFNWASTEDEGTEAK